MKPSPADALLDSQATTRTVYLFTLHRAGGGLAPVALAFDRAPEADELRAALELALARYSLPIATPERAVELLRAAGLGDQVKLERLTLELAHHVLDDETKGVGCRACAARDFNHQGFVLSLQVLEVLP